MLKMKDLDDKKYNELWENILSSYKKYSGEQTRFEASDPGITILETFTMLYDMQNYYRNYIGEDIKWSLLKSLGIKRRDITPSRGYIELSNVKGVTRLPQGTKFYAQDTVFETEKDYVLIENNIKRVTYGMPECDLTPMMKLESKIGFKPTQINFHASNSRENLLKTFLTIELEKEISKKSSIIIFVNIKEQFKNKKCNVIWEYKTSKGFVKARLCGDTTNSLSNTGIITFITDKKIEQDSCLIRAFISTEQLYEKDSADNYFPVITEVKINTIPIVQTDTVSKSICLNYRNDEININHYLAYSGDIIIFVKNSEGLWCDATDQFCIDKDDKGNVKISSYKLSNVNIKIILRDKDFNNKYKAYDITGGSTCSVQLVDIPLVENKLKLQIREKDNLYRDYELTPIQAEADSCPYGFDYDEKNHCLVFGNGRNYKVPKKSQGGCMFTDLVLCKGNKGNTAANKINTIAYMPVTNQIICKNAMPTVNGMDRESVEEAIERAGDL